MARTAKIIKPRRLYVPVVPANASWFESDSYDRRAWNEIVADAPSIGELAETGERLVPHFGALVQDMFLALFKMNPVFRKAGDVRLAAALNRTILEQIVPSAPFQALRSRTALEEDKAAIAAIVMSEHALDDEIREAHQSQRDARPVGSRAPGAGSRSACRGGEGRQRNPGIERQRKRVPSWRRRKSAGDENEKGARGDGRCGRTRGQGLRGSSQSEVAAVRNSAQGRGSERAQAHAAQDRRAGPRNRSSRRGQSRLQPRIRPGRPRRGRCAPRARAAPRA